MKKTKKLYWIFTSLFAFLMLGSAIPDILSMSDAVRGMHDALGYPLYFIPFIGVAKLLGVTAILVPGHPRLKEWAYAGLAFDLVGASFSIIAAGQGPGSWGFMILPLLLAGASYIFYRKQYASKVADKTSLRAGTSLAA